MYFLSLFMRLLTQEGNNGSMQTLSIIEHSPQDRNIILNAFPPHLNFTPFVTNASQE